MKTGIYLSYVGLGANLLHLAYCHQVAKKYGPVTIITLCKNLEEALSDDPLIEKVYYLEKYNKKLINTFKLSQTLKKFNFTNLLIFYPSLRIYISDKLAVIKNIFAYKFFEKKNLHLVKAAKSLTEKFLGIDNCQTETNFVIDDKKIEKINNQFKNSFKIVIGAGSSGPTTRWGTDNFAKLINKLSENGNYIFFILCGPNEKTIEDEIINKLNKKNYVKLSDKKIIEVVPYLCACNMYVGNDSFGSHISAQAGKKSIVFLLDSPKAYTDYSKNFFRLIPEGFNIDDITHNTKADPNLISVDNVVNKIQSLKN